MAELANLLRSIEYQFTKPQLLKLALTHPSAGSKNNQRLEFLGDAVLELCISDLLFQMHPAMSEGNLTSLRASLVCEEALYAAAQSIGLAEHLHVIPPLDEKTRGRVSILADAMEALLAAVYLDGGFREAQAVIRLLWEKKAESSAIRTNNKNMLQETLAAVGRPEPVYETILEQGPPHKRLFTVSVSLGGAEIARASGSSKKSAEQKAAGLALEIIASAEGGHEA